MLAFQQADSTGAARRVLDVVGGFTDYILDYAIALAAVGALAMALIEAAKKLADSRTRFHAKRWTQWMNDAGDGAIPEGTGRAAYIQLVQLTTGVTITEASKAVATLMKDDGHLSFTNGWSRPAAHAVFTLETARMMGAIQDAGDAALASPVMYRDLFDVITAGADANDIKLWLEKGVAAVPKNNDEVKAIADAFGRLRQIFKRKLDAFQLYTEQRWATYNQVSANVVGAIIMAAALIKLQKTLGISSGWLIILSVFGGVLSPIAKDLVGALRRVRSG